MLKDTAIPYICKKKERYFINSHTVLSIFRTNQIFTGILYIFYIVALWHPVFVFPSPPVHQTSGIFGIKLNDWSEGHLFSSQVVAILLLWGQALLVSTLVNRHRISPDSNLIPGLIYILVTSCFKEFLHLSPVLVANTFFLIALYNLFDTYKKTSCADLLFNTGLWLGIASLFYMPYLYFIVFCFIAINILRSANLKEYLIVLNGLMVTYFLAGVYFFWQDQLPWFFEQQFHRQAGFIIPHLKWDNAAGIPAGIFLTLILFTLFNAGSYTYKQNISTQKFISVLFLALFFGGVVVLFQQQISLDNLLITAIPVGIFLGITFSSIRNRLAGEMFHLILFTAVILTHYFLIYE